MVEKIVTFTAEFTFIGNDEFLFKDENNNDWTEKDFVKWLNSRLNVDDVQVKNLRKFVLDDTKQIDILKEHMEKAMRGE